MFGYGAGSGIRRHGQRGIAPSAPQPEDDQLGTVEEALREGTVAEPAADRHGRAALCEHALALVPRGKAFRVLDLCTGSGILAVTIALERPQSRVTACDLSEEALFFARQNAKALKADVTFCQGDLFDALPKGDVYDLIVSNPPYIPSPLLPSLQDEVQREPALALCGGEDGMDFYRRILDGIFRRLAPGGSLCLEGGDDQIGQIAELFSPYFQETACFDDLSGHPRGVCGKGFRP